ncbi:MAG: hypothetical protein AAGD06_28365, partial [Acidobacteriota bacterium]
QATAAWEGLTLRTLGVLVGLSVLAMGGPPCPASATEHSAAPAEQLLIELDHNGIESYRLELFDADGSRVFDSGLVSGAVALDLAPEVRSRVADLRFEVRGWNGSGELVFSQLSALGGDEIFSINFDVIPNGTTFLANGISLEGDVDVGGALGVAGGVSTPQLLDELGGNFFGTCPAGQLTQGIDADGSLVCAPDQMGEGDDLGNHQATETLVMGSQWIQANSGVGIRSILGAEVRTGPEGRTFRFQPAANFPAASTDIAQFYDQNGALTIAVPQEGSFKFTRGHKVCRAVDTVTNRSDAIIASDGWIADTCSGFANAVGMNSYQLVCVRENGFSFGALNSPTPPAVNCGW